MRNINWGLIGALLFSLLVWAAVGWALYNGLHTVQ
jgi:hypothetical protein